jgi:serine/threonine-protein kinase
LSVVVGELIAERYELEELVGTGGMSSVYRAHDRLLERDVALKVLHPQFTADTDYVERFRREARSVARLSHPNIVTVIDRGEQDGRQFIVFEYVRGENLKTLLQRVGPLPEEEAVRLALQIARALGFAHDNGLVHRDVKPQNVLLNGDGQAKVTDFGIARSLDVGGLTQTGTVMGTSDYIAPEQARGSQVDAQSDVYSLGTVLYELLTGEVPFPGDNFVAVALRHINEPPPSVRERRPDVSPRLDAVIRRAMAKEARDRFGSMDELCAELTACLSPETATSGAQTMVVPRPPADRPSVGPLILLLGGLAVLAAILAAVFALTDPGGEISNLVGNNKKTTRAAAGPSIIRERLRPGRRQHHTLPGGEAIDGDPPRLEHRALRRRPAQGRRRARGRCGLGEAVDQTRRPQPHARLHGEDRVGLLANRALQADFALAGGGRQHDVLAHGRRRAVLPGLDHRPRLELLGRDQRGERELVAQARAALVPVERELHQAVDEIRVRHPRGLEQLRVDARRGEAGDRVQLVDEHLAVGADEEVDPRHAFALAGDERLHGQLLDALDRLLLEPRRDDQVHPSLGVLGRVVVPVGALEAVRDDLTGQRRLRLLVAEHAALDLDAVDELLDEHLLVVLERDRDRDGELPRCALRDPDRGAELLWPDVKALGGFWASLAK